LFLYLTKKGFGSSSFLSIHFEMFTLLEKHSNSIFIQVDMLLSPEKRREFEILISHLSHVIELNFTLCTRDSHNHNLILGIIAVMLKHEHWPPFVRCLNSNCGPTILTTEGDSEDNEWSCYDVTPIDGAECRLQMPLYLKHNILFSCYMVNIMTYIKCKVTMDLYALLWMSMISKVPSTNEISIGFTKT
jgi:hypothetical protein